MTASTGNPKSSPPDDTVAFLTGRPGVEQVVQTHMVLVFLTADFAFKLKNPVSFGYCDHRTLAARANAGSEELRLNHALVGDAHIGTVLLVPTKDGIPFGGDGPVIDWIVQMQRLPADQMLDARIATWRASPSQKPRLRPLWHIWRGFGATRRRTATPSAIRSLGCRITSCPSVTPESTCA